MLTREEFQAAFIGGFEMGHEYTELQSLKIPSDKENRARGCAGALYDTAIDIPALRFLIEPKNKWWGRILAIGMFTVPMSKAIIFELRMKALGQAGGSTPSAAPVRGTEDGDPTPEQRAAMGAA